MEMTSAILSWSVDEWLTAKTVPLSVPVDLTVRDARATCTGPKTVNLQVGAVQPGSEYRLTFTPRRRHGGGGQGQDHRARRTRRWLHGVIQHPGASERHATLCSVLLTARRPTNSEASDNNLSSRLPITPSS